MILQIFDQNEWLYPDSEVSVPNASAKSVSLLTARNAYSGLQLLCNNINTEKQLNISIHTCPAFIKAQVYRLLPVLVEKNTAEHGFCICEASGDKPQYATRKAPFHVYDALSEYEGEMLVNNTTEAFYIAFYTEADAPAGEYDFCISVKNGEDDFSIKAVLRVYDAQVPKTESLFISNWFGLDQIAAQHNVQRWSQKHWELIKKYGELMRRTRQTHFLIPREAVVTYRSADGLYKFDFTHVKRLIEMFLSLGFSYIEGCMIARRENFSDGTFVVDICGKTVPALSEEGYDYISQYLTAWKAFIEENGWLTILWQHVADEPIPACAHEYRILSGIVRKFLPGVPLMEAVEMSELDGAVDVWIPKNSYFQEHREEFERIRKNGDKLWFYTCCIPGGFFLNRLWDMPLIRTRLLHWGNYLYDLRGYLHWGFNFCDADKDPYRQTDIIFPPGDTHISYPAGERVLSSMRLEAMRGGIEDYELFHMLSSTNKPLADKLAAKCLSAFDKPNEDVFVLREVRRELLEALEAARAYFTVKALNPLIKVFPDTEPSEERYSCGTALIGEHFSFQVMYSSKRQINKLNVNVRSELNECVSLYNVGLVPVELANYENHDGYILRSAPGLYPDLLQPFDTVDALAGYNHSIWVEINTELLQAGSYVIDIEFKKEDGKIIGNEAFTLTVLPVRLNKQKLLHTEWFYLDCLATEYNVEVLSQRHREIVANYIEHYAAHGMNMILTPLFTPPLETDFGLERPTVQLVGVYKHNDGYKFDFAELSWFIELCKSKGICYFEFSHLFSQWGAAYTPKIIAEVDGVKKQIFGWDVSADSPEYGEFLCALLNALDKYIQETGLAGHVYFHISDEPNLSNIDSYKKASELFKTNKLDYPVLDALSDYEFYKNGFVDCPVASTEHINKFLEHNVENLWAYYCCCEYENSLSNRFINMPGERTRIIGFQLYKNNIQGFLHWGYNHWYSARSRQVINPYIVTDAMHSFPAGDAFLVYPGKDGTPVSSVRIKYMRQAMQDIRAAQTLEALAGREAVLNIIDRDVPLTFQSYRHSPEALLNIREEINRRIYDITT